MAPRHARSAGTLALVSLALQGCGGGPSTQEIMGALAVTLPAIYLATLGVLWALERLRALPDRASSPLAREAGVTFGALAAAAVFVAATHPLSDRGLAVITFGAYGLFSLGLSLIVWRARLGKPYANRVLRAALPGVVLGLPAFVFVTPALDAVAEKYLFVPIFGSLGGIYVAPILLLGMLIESGVARARARKAG